MAEDRPTRNYIRFSPDENTLILVKFEDGTIRTGIAFSESHGGCGGVFRKSENYQIDMNCRIQVGKLPVSYARLAWIDPVDDHFVKLGFEYLQDSNDNNYKNMYP